jgi:hypothetical protein
MCVCVFTEDGFRRREPGAMGRGGEFSSPAFVSSLENKSSDGSNAPSSPSPLRGKARPRRRGVVNIQDASSLSPSAS